MGECSNNFYICTVLIENRIIMATNFVEELKWRGMLHDAMPGTEEHLLSGMQSAYVGIDPTADSLHIGHLVGVMMLKHFQLAGHKPYALIGGATGMIGDPSGKSAERNLLDEKTLRHNQAGLQEQLSRFLDFKSDANNAAVLVNNYDWMKNFSFLEFIRDVGKHITINYMMAKDSVKKRLSSEAKEGMSFTEFTYQMVQGYDFLHLFREHNCTLQMGGSDQWGNITTGTELIRRIGGGKGYALTCPLITKADGTKFGKTEGGNVWLDANRTSPYKFYQYWLNTSDADAEKYIKIFTFISKDEIEVLVKEHQEAPHMRLLQKRLADEITVSVHSQEDLDNAKKASNILFGKSTSEDLKTLDEKTFLDVFDGVPQAEIPVSELEEGLDMIGALAAKTGFLGSNGEARRELKQNSISVNKEKVKEDYTITKSDLINDKFVLLQRGKKNYFVLVVK
ncbi:tyrosyl-tRNA synthetase [Maribacter vaceletii]|uniref:Tyrosine--tRNA ligase n=2 Tax=Maribacter vaceletii TaxID=1206816 RepID=A0A495EDZ6_9FLAO|nr:tyrosyl-tRNA synthetase [Maribacter vaceletii]